jgi:uncharacterized SAM-binding protein YcdF (DUF218 family)
VSRVYVVLGAAVRAGGVPSPALRRRVEHAAALALARPDARLVLTGGVGEHGPSEAEVMARVAAALGVARDRMHLEEHATSTRESARNCARILQALDRPEVWIVTDAYHQHRARLAFRRVGIEARSTSPPAGVSSPLTRVRRRLREWIGLGWYWLTFRG